MEKMMFLKFFFYLLKRGSWHQSRFDFEGERRTVLKSLSDRFPLRAIPKPSYLRRLISRNNIASALFTNLAFVKNAYTMNNMFFICEAKKFVYVRILKSASTSLLKEILPALDNRLSDLQLTDRQIDALAFYLEQKKLTPSSQGFKRFALVRNPFERIVSVYLDLFDPAEKKFTYADYWFGILQKDMTFKEFVSTLAHIPGIWRGPHFSSQVQVLSASNLTKLIWFRIEKDQVALAEFLRGYDLTLPHRNKNASSYDYRLFYDEQCLQLVYTLFKEDVHFFGYEDNYIALSEYVRNLNVR